MPAWPGGTCPECGEYMPENLIHCQACRALLNDELQLDSVEIPHFQPLQELDVTLDAPLVGYYARCPHCRRELRVGAKYVGLDVECKFCHTAFPLNVADKRLRIEAFYCDCPYCKKHLRASLKYLGMKVACKHCSGKIHLGDSTAEARRA